MTSYATSRKYAEPKRVEDVQAIIGRGRKIAPPASSNRVLLWHDTWRNRDRVLRWQGPCLGCGVQLWAFDDGENDPRGVLGDSAMWGVDIPKRSETDLDLEARACPICANEYAMYQWIQRRSQVLGIAQSVPFEYGKASRTQEEILAEDVGLDEVLYEGDEPEWVRDEQRQADRDAEEERAEEQLQAFSEDSYHERADESADAYERHLYRND